MTKKKIGLMVAAVALVGAVAVGGTLAWFTDTADKENKMQLNHVEITVDEPKYKEDEVQDLVPGDKFVKDPTITVAADSAGAYVRVKAPYVVLPGIEENNSFPLLGEGAIFGAKLNDEANWIVKTDENGDTYYYYTKPLTAGQSLAFLEEQGEEGSEYTMQIPTTWNNDYADQAINLDFHFEAIQEKNFTPDWSADDPWDGAEIVENK